VLFALTLNGVPRLPEPPIGIFFCAIEVDPSETNIMYVADPAIGTTWSGVGKTLYGANTGTGIIYASGSTEVRVNSAGQVGVGVTVTRWTMLHTNGYIDLRGRDS
jgi:hypothetical protein